jgi:hypothetical protein
MPVRFTQKSGKIYLIVLGSPVGGEIRLRDTALEGKGRLLTDSSSINVRREGEDTILDFMSLLKGDFAPVVIVESAASF